MSAAGRVCTPCLRRTWLVERLAPYIANVWGDRDVRAEILALPDDELIAALAGDREARLRAGYRAFDQRPARARIDAAGLHAVCRHDDRYPDGLRTTHDPPAVLHIAGDPERFAALTSADAVAVVGARRASPYGLEAARALGRGLAAAGVVVVSGMALGIDSAAHTGALEVGGPTLAVLAGGADRPYPASKRHLYERLVGAGAVVSELPPGFVAHRWSFPARNRLIAGLAQATIVVEAAQRSGSLITAGIARDLGRDVAAVPGRVTQPQAAGTNALLKDGAHVMRDAQDALDLLFGAGARHAIGTATESLEPGLRRVLDAVASGRDTLAALSSTAAAAHEAMEALAELELRGRLRRTAGGRYAVVAS